MDFAFPVNCRALKEPLKYVYIQLREDYPPASSTEHVVFPELVREHQVGECTTWEQVVAVSRDPSFKQPGEVAGDKEWVPFLGTAMDQFMARFMKSIGEIS